MLLSFDGDVKVSDFGVRHALHVADQVEGAGSVCDDLVALGALLYEMLAGRRYVKGRSGDVRLRRTDLPESLAVLIGDLLSGGYDSAGTICDDLEEMLNRSGYRASPKALGRYIKALVGDAEPEPSALPVETPQEDSSTRQFGGSLAAAWRWTYTDGLAASWTTAGLLWFVGLAMGLGIALLFGPFNVGSSAQELARVRVIAPPDTQVSLDGDIVGREWTLNDDLPHVLGVSSDGFGEWETLLRVQPGEKRVYVFPSAAPRAVDGGPSGR